MACNTYLFHSRICLLLLRILMRCDDYQLITSRSQSTIFIAGFAASMMLNLSVKGTGGTLQEEEVGLSGSFVQSVICLLHLLHCCWRWSVPSLHSVCSVFRQTYISLVTISLTGIPSALPGSEPPTQYLRGFFSLPIECQPALGRTMQCTSPSRGPSVYHLQ